MTAACATPSAQHAAQSADHSAQGASHGSQAVVTGAASVVAVPLLVTGSVLTVSGAALEDIGAGSINAGADALTVAGQACSGTAQPCVAPNGPPTLYYGDDAMRRFFKALALSVLSVFPIKANAGSSAAANPVLPQAEVASFANRVQRDLAARGARVAIVSRVGRDPTVLPDGINYTHVAFWVFSQITDENGRTGQGYRIYNLYQTSGDLTRSALVQDTPADFFAGAHSLDAGIIIPDARLQQKLLSVIASPTYATLHNPRYSVLANPDNRQFQNCTEHTVDVIFAALYDITDQQQIKANVAAHFTPQPVVLGGLQRMLAPAASAALTTADHGTSVRTATFGSIARFMESYDLDDEIYRITPDALVRF
jgi:hypothetical protein